MKRRQKIGEFLKQNFIICFDEHEEPDQINTLIGNYRRLSDRRKLSLARG